MNDAPSSAKTLSESSLAELRSPPGSESDPVPIQTNARFRSGSNASSHRAP